MTYRLRAHPEVAGDLDRIAAWVQGFAGARAAERRLSEIEAAIAGLADLPHRGSRRDEVAPGLRAIPVGRRTVVAFLVDDERGEVLIVAVAHAGADWIARARGRS